MKPIFDIALILGTLLFLVVGTTVVAKIYGYAASLLTAHHRPHSESADAERIA